MRLTPLNRAALSALAALFAATVLAPLGAQAQTWEYKSYKKKGLGGQYEKDNFVVGTVKLEEKDGKATVQLNAGAMDACRRAEAPAQVTRTDAEITIEPEVSMAGCERWRLIIRTDGSGGRREVWRNDKWVDTKWDHGLTPKK